MPRPPSMPKPRLRKGARTYEIRVRVPEAARGGRFKGSHTTRTLRTTCERDAYRNLPDVHEALIREFAAEQAMLSASNVVVQPVVDVLPATAPTVEQDSLPRRLSVSELYRNYRAHILKSESKRRELTTWLHKNISELNDDPSARAVWLQLTLPQRRKAIQERQIVRDFDSYKPFLNDLEKAGRIDTQDRRDALEAFCQAELDALDAIIRADRGRLSPSEHARPRRGYRRETETSGSAPSAQRIEIKNQPTGCPTQDQQPPNAHASTKLARQAAPTPTLSQFINSFIERRGASMSAERAGSYRAIVRDLIEVRSDKAVTDYGFDDADAFETVLRALPANWRKKPALRELTISAAAKKAAKDGLKAQAPKNVRKKWTMLGTIFRQVTVRYGGTNPFQPDLLQIDRGASANAQWDGFTAAELAELLASHLDGPLFWLTRLALYTGARTNELCQLTTGHVRCHEGVHYVYFSPELRLKTGEKESCVRAVPLRHELIQEGFLDFVDKADGLLFPGLTQHSTGRYSDAIGKKFTYHLKKIGLKRPKLSFKSLRHAFVAEFKRCAPTDVETRERLIGHAVPGVAGRYGSSYEAEALDLELLQARAKVLDKLRFDLRKPLT